MVALTLVFIVAVGLFWIWPIVLANSIGRRKGRENSWLWGFILGWVGVIIVASSATRQPLILPAQIPRMPDPTKPCPACAESVKAAARVCRWCGHEFA
jgi:hypothetical protein